MQTILDFFERHRARNEPLVLATVVDTAGSTYSKLGERLLVSADGQYRGLLSGGCLEGDLALRAAAVIESGAAELALYDFRGEDDELFGMGIGCEGALTILLQPLTPGDDYAPFQAVADVLASDHSAVLVTDVSPSGPSLGASALIDDSGVRSFGLNMPPELINSARAVREVRRSARHVFPDESARTALLSFVEPPPRFLILGAGPDVVPLLRMAEELGWRCTVVDHRPAYIAALPDGVDAHCLPAESFADGIALDVYDRALVMSHHLASDRSYLRQLAQSRMNYIGLLGPPARKERLLKDLGDDAERIKARLHGPAGLNIGGRGPAAIALSILAEIQSLLH